MKQDPRIHPTRRKASPALAAASIALTLTLAVPGVAAAQPTANLLALDGLTATAPAHGKSSKVATAKTSASQIVTASLDSEAVGTLDYAVYLPPGYESSQLNYPTVYLLHGRGDTMSAWQRMASTLDHMIAEQKIQPMIVVMPDAPWNDRGNWYTDSQFAGSGTQAQGEDVETAFTRDLVAHIDSTYRTVADREARAVGGYSMGGAGALRMSLAHQDVFSSGIILSPAVYTPAPPSDSSTREYGAYGTGSQPFDQARYDELNYPNALEAMDTSLPVHLFIGVGDDEWPNPAPEDAQHDLDFEAAKLYNTARRAPAVTAELRIVNGGHDWDAWEPLFIEAITDISPRLRTTPRPTWDGTLLGTSGDDRAGGIAVDASSNQYVAYNLDGTVEGIDGVSSKGGFDILVQKSTSGATEWSTLLGTSENDRAYGIVVNDDGSSIIGGYSRGGIDGSEAKGNDDAIAVGLAADGTQTWAIQFGDPTKADRAYAMTSDGQGGAYLTGYTSGAINGATAAGDKDIFIARVSGTGELLWVDQMGSSGEDKGLAVVLAPDGSVVVGGLASGAFPGQSGLGSGDAFTARYTADGERMWVSQFGTDKNDQLNALALSDNGKILAVGTTKGAIGDEALGDNDAFVVTLSLSDGSVRGGAQFGTDTDDRGATINTLSDGSYVVTGATYGSIAEPMGNVDVFYVHFDKSGKELARGQFGSRERDGSDEWDDLNLFAATTSASVNTLARTAAIAGLVVSGLTYGAPQGAANQGSGDVFVSTVPLSVKGGSGNGTDGGGTDGGGTDGSGTDTPSTDGPTDETGTDGAGGGSGTPGSGTHGGGSLPDALAKTGLSIVLLGFFVAVFLGAGGAFRRGAVRG